MSDDEEYEYEYGSDAEYDYGSDQDNGDGEGGNDASIEIENSFYGQFTLLCIVVSCSAFINFTQRVMT
jgi:hypothetical protein